MTDAPQTTFRPGEILLCECEWETIRVIFDGGARDGMALVSPESDPEDGFFVKLSDLRRVPAHVR